MSLSTKTIALLTAIVLAVLAATSLFSLDFQQRTLKETIFKGVDGQARVTAHSIAAFVEESLREAAAVALAVPGDALVEGRLGDVEAGLARMARTFPKFQNGIFVLDRSGTFLADSPPHPELRGESFAFRDYYQRTVAEDRGVVGVPYRSKRTGRPVLTFTAPVRGAGGRMVAIVACSVDLLSREALGGYRELKYGDTGYLFLIDRARTLVLHPQDERLLTTVEEGRNKVLDAAVQGFEGAAETVNSVGVPMLVAMRRVPGTDWIAAVQMPQEEAYRPLVEARARVGLMSAVAVLLAVVLGAAAIRSVSRPLEQLERAALELGEHLEGATALEARAALASLARIRSGDEIGRLASSFRQLATRLEQTLGSLRRAADDWERTFNSVGDAVVTLDVGGRIARMNLTAQRWFGLSEAEALGRPAHEIVTGAPAPPAGWPEVAALARGEKLEWAQALERPRGRFELTLTPIAREGAMGGSVLIVKDVTEGRRLEEELRHAQKMEAVGRLANGVAHDFNNMLTVILSTGRAARDELAPGHPLREDLEEILATAGRAAALTRQLLEFSQRQAISEARTLDLGEAVRCLEQALRRLLGDGVELRLVTRPQPCPVRADPGQLDQIVLNLAANARDAMPSGGRLTIEVGPVDPDDPATRRDSLPSGPLVCLSVSDTGVGMSEATRARIFEPFFTTKSFGKGAGLGLTAVYGIVQQGGGAIRVTSAPGSGTTLRVYLPLAAAPDGAPGGGRGSAATVG